MSGPFATASELSEYLELPLPNDLSRWQSHLGMASAEIRSFTHQTLSRVTGDVIVLPALERSVLLLPERPVTAITQVQVSGVTISSSAYWFTRAGLLYSGSIGVEGANWSYGASVTYTHGYAETTDEFALFRSICISVAARSLLLNIDGAAQAMGGFVMETAGFAPTTFLTEGEKMKLADYGMVLVG